jgi:RHS repeat-associated protein
VPAAVDGFGRAVFSQRKQSPTASDYDTSEVDYNNLGQPYRSTMPYSTTASPSSDNTTAPATTTTYDALGRALTVTDADSGTVTYTYTNNDVLQQVSGGQTFQKQLEYDGLGRLTSVCEISSTLTGVGTCSQTTSKTGYWTTYTYDALGRLLTVTQNAQAASGSRQARSFTYDWLGRMTSESNPESGTTHYYWDTTAPDCSYGVGGSLSEKKDNAGVVTCYYFDTLHRLQAAEAGSGGSSPICRIFAYDSLSYPAAGTPPTGYVLSNGAGRMIEASTNNCSNGTVITDVWFSYSPRGEKTDAWELTPHSTAYYHTTASYWPTGSLETLGGIPSVPTIYYGTNASGANYLDGEGRYTGVTAASGTSPVTGVTYSTSSTMNPLGALTGVTFGSADSDSFTYDPNTGRMATYTFSVDTKTDAGTLTWNANGTLTKLVINDQIPGTADSGTCTYGYDDLQRVSNATCGTVWVQNFTYDAFGNISKSVPTGDGGLSFLPTYWTSPPKNQFSSLPGVTVSYDANGNLLTDNLNSYTWDTFGNMATVTTGSTTVTATYDALGRMVENNAGGSYTEFVYGPTGAKLAKCNGTTLVRALIALPGGAKAIYNTSGLAYYRHSDWLGSSRLTSTASRTMYSSSAYAPFGEQYGTYPSTGSLDPSFTGQDQDTVNNLYDFPARRQSSSQGRWISPDPAGRGAVKLTNPQSWNRYAYVNNNPLRLIDPTGMDDCVSDPYQGSCMGPGQPGGGGGAGGGGGGGDSCTGDDCGDDGNNGNDGSDGNVDSAGDTNSDDPACTVTVGVNNMAGLTPDQVSAAEQQISNLFATPGPAPGGVGVNFVSGDDAANAPYQLNLTTYPSPIAPTQSTVATLGTTYGPQDANVYLDNISQFPNPGPASFEQMVGTVGAHELFHAITGLGDVTDPGDLTDIMGAGNMSFADQVSGLNNNTYTFTYGEAGELLSGCTTGATAPLMVFNEGGDSAGDSLVEQSTAYDEVTTAPTPLNIDRGSNDEWFFGGL